MLTRTTQTREVPHANGLIQGGRDNQVLGGVELGAHYVMAVTGEDAEMYAVVYVYLYTI